MTPTLTIQELALAISTPNHSPTLLTADFLKASGIVPDDWELARPAIRSPQLSQVAFTNGINIVAQPGVLTFIESLGTKPLEEVKVPTIARSYIESLPRLNYQSVTINPRSFATFPDSGEGAALSFIAGTLLSPDVWASGIAPVKAAVNLVYALESGELALNIGEAMLQIQDSEPLPAVLFSGSFGYAVTGEKEGEKLQHLYQLLENWQPDLETYRKIVNSQLLGIEVA